MAALAALDDGPERQLERDTFLHQMRGTLIVVGVTIALVIGVLVLPIAVANGESVAGGYTIATTR